MTGRGYGTGVGVLGATTAGGVHGFPAALTSFIGRNGPVREVAGLPEEYRLVTVTGPAWHRIGKVSLPLRREYVWVPEQAHGPDPLLWFQAPCGGRDPLTAAAAPTPA